MTTNFKPKIYSKNTCPFCFKVLLFLTEAGLIDQFEIISADAEDEAEMDKYRRFLEERTGQKASFPTIEIAPGEYLAESDALIEHYAKQHDIDPASMKILAYYLDGPFKQQIALFKENLALKKS